MRARKASVSAVEVTSPRAIRLPASAMLSVVRSAVLRLLIGAEHVRRFGGPSPTGGNTLHQGGQSGIALVQVLDVLRRERQACQRGTRTKFLKRWWFLFCHPILPRPSMQSTCRPGPEAAYCLGLALACSRSKRPPGGVEQWSMECSSVLAPPWSGSVFSQRLQCLPSPRALCASA